MRDTQTFCSEGETALNSLQCADFVDPFADSATCFAVYSRFSGYNTAWALCHLEDLSKSALLAGPDAVVIFFGANDSHHHAP